MDILALLGAYATIIATTLGVGKAASELMTVESKKQSGVWLDTRVKQKPIEWIRANNRAFLQIFGWTYGAKGTLLERSIWIGLILSPATVLVNHTFFRFTDEEESAVLLAFATIETSSIIFVLLFSKFLSTKLITLILMIGAGLAFANIVGGYFIFSIYEDFVGSFLDDSLIFVSTAISHGVLNGLLISILFRSIGDEGVMSLREFRMHALFIGAWSVVGGSAISLFSNLDLISAVTTGLILGIAVFVSLGILQEIIPMPVHPIKSLVSSVVFMIILGLVMQKSSSSFISEMIRNPYMLAFVAFNMFADAFSLLETRWVLRSGAEAPIWYLQLVLRVRGKSKSVRSKLLPRLTCHQLTPSWHFLVFLLILDLLLSAAIFLVLPAILGEIPAFLEAMLFRGDRPWLGILFWTTFSTSFVLASLLVRPLSRIVVVGRYFDVQGKPVLAITFAFAVTVTLLFWGAVGGVGLYRVIT